MRTLIVLPLIWFLTAFLHAEVNLAQIHKDYEILLREHAHYFNHVDDKDLYKTKDKATISNHYAIETAAVLAIQNFLRKHDALTDVQILKSNPSIDAITTRLGNDLLMGAALLKDMKEDRLLSMYVDAISGERVGQYNMGVTYRDGSLGEKRDPKLAIEWFTKAATQDYPLAAYAISTMFKTGDGVRKDLKKAAVGTKRLQYLVTLTQNTIWVYTSPMG